MKPPGFTILIAEDDPDDKVIAVKAFRELRYGGDLRFVEDGQELVSYLHRSGKYADTPFSLRPSLILLDLNMPKKDGRQALVEIKADPDLQRIPVVVWTTSEVEEDRVQCLNAGADAFVTKPSRYGEVLDRLREIVMTYASEID